MSWIHKRTMRCGYTDGHRSEEDDDMMEVLICPILQRSVRFIDGKCEIKTCEETDCPFVKIQAEEN